MSKIMLINYIYQASECECRAYNLVFLRLYTEKDIDKDRIFKILSGLKEKRGSNAKVRKPMMKSWLRKWHKNGLITIFRDKVRLGNIMLATSMLNKKSKDLLLEELATTSF